MKIRVAETGQQQLITAMFDLPSALSSGELSILLITAVSLGFLHTILGPDHYIPFVMMAKAQNWTRRKTAWVTFLCGVGHVASSIVIAVLLAAAGMAAVDWESSSVRDWHEARGDWSAWLLIGVGVAFLVWGTVRALRGKRHTHPHVHDDGTVHRHEHDHSANHMHAHEAGVRKATPWVLFTIFIFGPCESLIPLVLAAWAISGFGGVTMVAGAFSIATIATIMLTVLLLLAGIARVPLGPLDKWSSALAGASLVLCGAAIRWLGL